MWVSTFHLCNKPQHHQEKEQNWRRQIGGQTPEQLPSQTTTGWMALMTEDSYSSEPEVQDEGVIGLVCGD